MSALDPRVLAAAAQWYVQLQGAPATLHEEWQRWHDADAAHARAWSRLLTLQQRLQQLPADIALPALGRIDAQRRGLGKALLLSALAGPVVWSAAELLPWRMWTADWRTQTGERRRLMLADGSRVQLNTATALDVRFDAGLRLLRLQAGEVLIETAPDARPFIVSVAQGRIRALGTRFAVRVDAERSRVAVFEHAVELRPRDGGAAVRVDAGQQRSFSAQAVDAAAPLDPNAQAWTRGMLIAPDWPLARFVAELARYRPGHLGCDPAIARLRVSGAFRVDDVDGALDNLAASLPVRIESWSRYWTRVLPR